MKKKYLFFLMFFFINVFVFSQIGVNIQNPQKAFHIDPKGNTVTITNSEQIKDDFIVKENGSVGIGTLTPSDFSALEIISDKGFRLPQLSPTEIGNLDPVVTGLMLFNTESKCINIRAATKWIEKCACIPVEGPLSIKPDASIPLTPGSIVTFSVSDGTNMIGGYTWTFNNGNSQTGSSVQYQIPSGISSLKVSVTVKGCDSSQYTENVEYTVTTPVNTTEGDFINTTPTGNNVSESLLLKGVTGSRFEWTMYYTDATTYPYAETGSATQITTTNSVAFSTGTYNQYGNRQYRRVVVKVYNSAGIQTHERTYTNILCQGAEVTLRGALNCINYRKCTFSTNGSITRKWIENCSGGSRWVPMTGNFEYIGVCTDPVQAGFTCPNTL